MEQQETLLELKDISKQYPGVKALDNVSLTLKKGEVLGLVGENGAGKSTLVKIINGVSARDEGVILIKGNPVEMHNSYEAKMIHKIAYVSQENTLCPNLTVGENMSLGEWKKGKGFINWKKINDFAEKALMDLGLQIKPTELLSRISPSDRQLVEIARAVSMDSQILLLDEPTSWLSESEKTYLFDRIEYLKTKNVGIIFISHFLDEVLKICDRVQVLREGKNVDVFQKTDLTKKILIEKMLGKKQEASENEENISDRVTDKIALKVSGMTQTGIVNNISFDVHAGEILGITGLFGCGKSELGRMIFGAENAESGEVYIDGARQKHRNPRGSIDSGIGYITKDRKEEGIVPLLTIAKNITLANFKSVLAKIPVLNLHKEKEIAKKMIDVMDIRPKNPDQQIVNLSGGNQQKVIIAKWLQANSKVLILDEPTRGIDIGAKYEIYKLLKKQAKDGKAIVFISSELSEVLNVCDRVITIKNGYITGEYKHGEIKDEHELLSILTA
jgi:ribose transport system ATP-binding protein